MEFKTKRLITLTNYEKDVLIKADDIICEIKSNMHSDSMNNLSQQLILHMYNDYNDDYTATYSDICVLDAQLYRLAHGSEIITSFDEGDEDGA